MPLGGVGASGSLGTTFCGAKVSGGGAQQLYMAPATARVFDAAEQAARHGADLPVRAWVKRLKCSQCGSRSVDFVLTGARR